MSDSDWEVARAFSRCLGAADQETLTRALRDGPGQVGKSGEGASPLSLYLSESLIRQVQRESLNSPKKDPLASDVLCNVNAEHVTPYIMRKGV